jgi:putative tricarboxylic transport membrane protein
MRRYRLLSALLVLPLLCGCAGQGSGPEEAPGYPQMAVSLVAPAGSGSGYDVTMRALAGCLQETGLVRVPLPITNIPGGGGVTALEFLDSNRGADNVLSVYSPPLNMVRLNGSTAMNYRENTTPVARLVVDYGVFAVRSDSPFQTLEEVMNALKEDPGAVRLGGISSYGSMDHLQFLKAAHASGVGNLGQIAYTGYQDGTAVAQLLGGHVDVVSTGISDSIGLVESGDIRALAVTAGKRVGKGLTAQIPTCIEQGIDVTFVNWRGIFGPKGMPDYALAYWEETLGKMVKTPEWAETCAEYGWDMDYADHEEFMAFLDEMDIEYAKLLGEIGFLSAEHNKT